MSFDLWAVLGNARGHTFKSTLYLKDILLSNINREVLRTYATLNLGRENEKRPIIHDLFS